MLLRHDSMFCSQKMSRGKISMELIQNEKSRKLTFQKRKNGLLKKVNELSILCDVDVLCNSLCSQF
jgi:hypothetical protein